MEKKRILVIHNPTAGARSRARLAAVVACLEADGHKVMPAPTEFAGHGRDIAAGAADVDVIVAAGGDGTVNEVLNGLTSTSPAFAFLPLGTANVLAHELGLAGEPAKIAETIVAGVPISITCGRIRGPGIDDQRFLLMASLGADALAVAALNPALKKKIGPLAYVVAAISAARELPAQSYQVAIDGERHECAGLIVTKAVHYGGAYKIAPKADLSKDSFEILLLQRAGIQATVKFGAALLKHSLAGHRDVLVRNGRSIEIDALGKSQGEPALAQPVQVDGDAVGTTPVTIEIDDLRPRLLVPPAYAKRLQS